MRRAMWEHILIKRTTASQREQLASRISRASVSSACTCPGSDHPGPSVTTGRSAPEIDILEAEIDVSVFGGQVSQSLQVAPFNANYQFDNASSVTPIQGSSTQLNGYKGGLYQQAVSALTNISSSGYNGTGYAPFAYEWWSNPNHRSEVTCNGTARDKRHGKPPTDRWLVIPQLA
jgi:hypothetical protein